jgi:ABC-type transporter Mla MlaB component
MNPGKIEVSEIEGRFAPEAREAALCHAGGRAADAEALLVRSIGEPHAAQDSRLLWLMLLELYRLQGRATDFDQFAARYGATFGKPAPAWSGGEAAPDNLPAELRPGGPAYSALSGELAAGSSHELDGIRRAAAHHAVLHVDASRIERLTIEGCELLSRELEYALANGNGIFLTGAAHLERLLRRCVDATPGAAPAWRLLLNLYQLEGRQKAFETTAMEYALAAEVDPPRWEPILMPVVPRETAGERRGEPRYDAPDAIFLRGEISGPKDPQLAALRQFAQGRKYVNIDLQKLYRIDAVGAASLGNIVLALNNLGKVVRVLRPNLLVDTLLCMLGIDGHAQFVSHQRPQ